MCKRRLRGARGAPTSRLALCWLASVTLAACGDLTEPAKSRPGALLSPQNEISDALHNEGNDHFFWLPPLVADPGSFNGSFDGSQELEVDICEWTGSWDNCATRVAVFTTTTAPGSETIRVVDAEEHYIASWHTDQFNVDQSKTYRIVARVDGQALGHADVMLTDRPGQMKNMTNGASIVLKDGRTLTIKCRVERGAVGRDILFSSSVDGSGDVWGINADGTSRVNLSRVSHDSESQFEDGGGRWSPDGTKILFHSNKSAGVPRKVFIMNADGSDAHPLNNNSNTEVDPFWGADGTKIYYGRNTRYPNTDGGGCAPCPYWEIYEYDLTTGQETRLTFNNYRDEHAVASPDGNFIAFRRAELANDCCNPTSVWIMDADGQNPRRITPNNWQYETPYDWDGVSGKILTHWKQNEAVVLMDPDGTAEQLATGGGGVAFSPDGSTILLARSGDIYFLDVATREITPFLVEPGGQHPSDWRGPGSQ